jgi:transposase
VVRGRANTALKADKVDARTLARLLAGGLVPEVWLPDERTRRLRRLVSRRAQLVRQRTRAKNQVHAALIRNLRPRQPMRDLFGVAGRRWLATQELPADEQETVASCLREIDFLAEEIKRLELAMAHEVLGDWRMRRLLALPGISSVAACTLVAAIGDISRFPTQGHLVGYIGLNPRVRQSGSTKPRHGRIQAGPRRGPPCPGRGRLARDAGAGAAAALRRAGRREARQQCRGRRRRAQAARDHLAPPHA